MHVDKRVFLYQKTGLGEKQLLDEIYIFTYQKIQSLYSLDEDSKGDFFVFFLPKIKRLMSSYKDMGSSFFVYLCSHLKFQLRTFVREQKERKLKQYFFLHDTLHEENTFPATASEESSSYVCKNANVPQLLNQTKGTKRRLLFLILKYAEYVSLQNLDTVSKIINIPEFIITAYLIEARIILQKKNKKYTYLQNRREYYFFQMYYALYMQNYALSEIDRKNFQEKAVHYAYHLKRVQTTLKYTPRLLTHREIGIILNIPKGTIDSGIYYLKKLLEKEVHCKTELPYVSDDLSEDK